MSNSTSHFDKSESQENDSTSHTNSTDKNTIVREDKRENMIRQMFITFDQDQDGHLNYEESGLFQWITDGNMLPPMIWDMVCEKVGVANKEMGMSFTEFRSTYMNETLAKELDADLVADYRQFVKWKVQKAQKAKNAEASKPPPIMKLEDAK